MTTLKPQLIRADTLDLQAQDAPSAKDHTRQPTHPAPYGIGPAAPHQNQELRNAEQETIQAQRSIPKVSPGASEEQVRGGAYPEEPDFYDDHSETDDHEQSAPHEHLVGEPERDSGVEDGEMGDQGDDDSLDDDMMDKISSSPSIDDGKYSLPIMWPPRRDSVDSGATHSPFSTPMRGKPSSSSPFTSTPDYFPLSIIEEKHFCPESHQGEYTGFDNTYFRKTNPSYDAPVESSPPGLNNITGYQGPPTDRGDYTWAVNMQDVEPYLLPVDDPLLDNSFDDGQDDMIWKDDDEADDWEDDDEDQNTLSRYDSSSDDDIGDFQFTDDSRFIDSGWGGECLREIEDIDFEFVYALHTFVATVEGQANATKGDTMVLLDDSNSYWWLVRVVKDGSIGYLPAEHIETPTERLARLNKHRNIDLSATMLGDNPEKSKNPLKKAMRRRNAKTVQFAPPQYFEPSDYEYSDEEEEGQEGQIGPVENGAKSEGEDVTQGTNGDSAVVAPLKINTQQSGSTSNGIQRIRSNESMNSDKQASPEKTLAGDEVPANETQEEANLRSTRKGVVRNTDSFYKDDSVETKKISLTPRLLRGDSDVNVVAEQPETRQRPSLDTFDKIVAADDDRPKDDKKKKEKKGMLSGLFKRKDKKTKAGDIDNEDSEKVSEESTRLSPQSRESQDSLSGKPVTSPQRQTSKLQKPPPVTKPTTKLSPIQDAFQKREGLAPNGTDLRNTTSPEGQNFPSTVRPVVTEPPNGPGSQPNQASTPDNAQLRTMSPTTSPTEKRSFFSHITPAALKSSAPNTSTDGDPVVKAVYAKKAKHRFEIDAADSEDETTPTATIRDNRSISPLEAQQLDEGHQNPRLDTAGHISPMEPPTEKPPPPPSQAPPPIVDNPSTSEPPLMAPPSPSRSSSPSLVDIDTANEVDRSTNTTTTSPRADAHTPSTARSTPTWSDASLRYYMDNDQDIRDLLIIVHDKSNVVPAGPDHPITGHLFAAEKGRLAEMQTNLDSMLTNWLSRKNSTLLTR